MTRPRFVGMAFRVLIGEFDSRCAGATSQRLRLYADDLESVKREG